MFCQYIDSKYIALQNTDFGVHFLISIFFPLSHPRSVLRASNNEDLFFLQFCSYKCVLSIFIYNIALQNTDFGVLQKSSKHFLISIFFQMGRGDIPLPDPPPAWHFVPRTRASPLSITIHAPPFHQILDPPLQWELRLLESQYGCCHFTYFQTTMNILRCKNFVNIGKLRGDHHVMWIGSSCHVDYDIYF